MQKAMTSELQFHRPTTTVDSGFHSSFSYDAFRVHKTGLLVARKLTISLLSLPKTVSSNQLPVKSEESPGGQAQGRCHSLAAKKMGKLVIQ
jgi:hypothetical protein